MRTILAVIAGVAIVSAIPAHLGGFENIAEVFGIVAFVALLCAVVLPPRRDESGDDPQ
jgi:hypothetical protein